VEKNTGADYFIHPYYFFIKFTPLIKRSATRMIWISFFTPLNFIVISKTLAPIS